MKVLVFDRPFTKKFFSYYSEIDGIQVTRISDFKFHGDIDTVSQQYFELKSGCKNRKFSIDFSDVIIRDRFLRNIDKVIAIKLCQSVYAVYDDLLESNDFELVLGPPIDNYYLDILSRLCEMKGIRNEFLIQSFLPGLTRITKRGEYRAVRDVPDDEVNNYVQKLSAKTFKPTTLKPHWSVKGLIRIYLKERVKKIIFTALKIIKRDPFSFHYNCIYPMAGAITVNGLQNISVRKKFAKEEDVLSKLEEKVRENKKIVFFPLQFSPETTIDYYIKDTRFTDYNKLIQYFLDSVPNDWFVVVKEHPDIYGYRSAEFYEMFSERSNMILADVSMTASYLIEKSDIVVVTGGGSVGVEAVAKGKTVLSLGDAYYKYEKIVEVVEDYDEIPTVLNKLEVVDISRNDIKKFVAHVLKNTLKGPYDFVRSKSINAKRDKENINEIINYFKKGI